MRERDCLLIERQIVKLARELGFQVYYPKNKASIRTTSKDELRAIFVKQGLGDNYEEEVELPEVVEELALVRG